MRNIETKGVKNIFFLCSPNLGILDNWLPVLYSVKKYAPHINVLLFFPKMSIAEQISSKNVFVDIGEEVFSEVVMYWYDLEWRKANSMLDAKNMAKSAVSNVFFIPMFKNLKPKRSC